MQSLLIDLSSGKWSCLYRQYPVCGQWSCAKSSSKSQEMQRLKHDWKLASSEQSNRKYRSQLREGGSQEVSNQMLLSNYTWIFARPLAIILTSLYGKNLRNYVQPFSKQDQNQINTRLKLFCIYMEDDIPWHMQQASQRIKSIWTVPAMEPWIQKLKKEFLKQRLLHKNFTTAYTLLQHLVHSISGGTIQPWHSIPRWKTCMLHQISLLWGKIENDGGTNDLNPRFTVLRQLVWHKPLA